MTKPVTAQIPVLDKQIADFLAIARRQARLTVTVRAPMSFSGPNVSKPGLEVVLTLTPD